GLIIKAVRHFIETARRGDRISIITFTEQIKVITPLTSDRAQLLKSVNKLGDTGASNVWDALSFAVNNAFGEKQAGRRRAVVFLTDGVDNALEYPPRGSRHPGSSLSFAQLLQTVRQDDTLVIPIYVDTEEKVECAINV